MNLSALKAVLGPSGLELVRTALDPDVISKAKGMPPERAVVYLLKNDGMKVVLELKDAVIDRGKKDKRKGLAQLLLRCPKVPVIRGTYKDQGQLKRGIRDLLRAAERKDVRNIFVVQTSAKLFKALAAEAKEEGGEEQDKEPQTFMVPVSSPGAMGESTELMDLLPEYSVPAKLTEMLIGHSRPIMLVRQLILRATEHEEPVLVLGETGSGKEVVSRSIHLFGPRCSEPFTAINCGAIPRELLESELFGHVKGSFTGAHTDKEGLWKAVGMGTLLLDEIGDLPPEHQVKVLRALEENTIRPVGSTKEVKVHARIVAATNRDLFGMVENGQFREDLYYRLRTFMIQTPALREHQDDIPLLAQYFWQEITRDDNATLDKRILSELRSYRWPGNARELKVVLRNMYALFGADGLRLDHLRGVFQMYGQAGSGKAPSVTGKEIDLHRVECLRHLKRADEVVRASKVALRPIIAHRRIQEQLANDVEGLLRYRLEELDLLCRHPLLFHSESTFTAIYQLKGKLSYFHSLLVTQPKQARQYWNAELSEQFQASVHAIFAEVEGLLG